MFKCRETLLLFFSPFGTNTHIRVYIVLVVLYPQELAAALERTSKKENALSIHLNSLGKNGYYYPRRKL